MKLTGWIIYTEEDYIKNHEFARRFIDQGGNHNMEMTLVMKEDISFGIKGGSFWLGLKNNPPYENRLPDFAINRTLDAQLSRHLEAMGAKVFNNSGVSEICNDKARTYQEAARLGLPMVDTLFLSKNELLNENESFFYPAVLKSVGGRGGKEVFLVKNHYELISIASAVSSDRFVLQRLCGNPGIDVRVFVMGKKIIGAIKRSSKLDFKANYTLGGKAEVYTLNENEKELVMRLCDRFDFGFAGIDFIFDDNNRFLFNEIEDVVGSRTLCIYAGVNVAGLYLEHIRSVMDSV